MPTVVSRFCTGRTPRLRAAHTCYKPNTYIIIIVTITIIHGYIQADVTFDGAIKRGVHGGYGGNSRNANKINAHSLRRVTVCYRKRRFPSPFSLPPTPRSPYPPDYSSGSPLSSPPLRRLSVQYRALRKNPAGVQQGSFDTDVLVPGTIARGPHLHATGASDI